MCILRKYFKRKSNEFHQLYWSTLLAVLVLFCVFWIFLISYIEKFFYASNVIPVRNNTFKMVCYYNFPKNGNDLQPEEIPYSLCTHINLAFAEINITDYSLQLSVNNLEIVPRLSFLKTKNKNLKIIISVGGAGSNGFSQMVKTHANRMKFVNSTMKFIKKFQLDGIDIDWEWPSNNGDIKEKVKFIQLLQEIREEFDRHQKKYILSIAAGALQYQVQIYYFVSYIPIYVDFINLMTYDYHFYTSYYPVTDYNAPLYASAKDRNTLLSNINVNFSVHYWIAQSVPPNKLILGLPAFGHTYTLISSLNHYLHAPASGIGSVGENGFINFNESCQFLKDLNTFRVMDDDSKVPYAYNQYNWISYDDEESIKIKVEFLMKMKLGGAMLYSLNAEDFTGSCREDKLKFPLLNKIQSVLHSN